MKKSTLALSVILILGGVWTGAAWYTGKTAESEYQQQLDKLNERLAANVGSGYRIKAEISEFSRGLFSSEIAYNVLIDLPDGSKSQKLPFSGTLYHGPLPLNLIKQLNFTPALFSVYSELVKNEDNKEFFENSKDKNPLTDVMTLTYSKRLKGYTRLAQGKMNLEGVELSWQDSSLDYDADYQGAGEYKYEIKGLHSRWQNELLAKLSGIEPKDYPIETMEINIDALQAVNHIAPTEYPYLYTGKQEGKLGNLQLVYTYSGELNKVSPAVLEVKDWAFDYDIGLNQGFINAKLNNNIADLSLNKQSLGKVQLDMQLNHLAAAALNQILDYNRNPEQLDDDKLQAQFEAIVQNQPQIKISSFAISNSGGKLGLDFNLELAEVDFAKLMQQEDKILDMLKQFELRVKADKAAFTQSLATLLRIGGMNEEEADKQAALQSDEAIQAMQHQNIVTADEKSFASNLVLEEGKLKLNGEVIPEEYLAMFLLSLLLQ
ncbi:YdgA family protein [Mesocricetibacter intestinalis]|uniref:YdgA family protein n=1 Tax=Mesocricetibacter intestinalis TaxID=1521930 RepID=UPI00105C241D|nr:YdgA family protein [Mesocricetibacter intestinalis]